MTYRSSYNPLPLYFDEECTRAVPFRESEEGIVYEAMSFTKLDGGAVAESSFYIRNASMGVVDDLTVSVESVSKDDVLVELVSESPVARLAVKDVYHGVLRWSAVEGVKAGRCLARIAVSGMLTQE